MRQPKRATACRAVSTDKIAKKDVPLALEEGEMPMNTFNSKKPFKATIKSVERIVGPKVRPTTFPDSCVLRNPLNIKSAQSRTHF